MNQKSVEDCTKELFREKLEDSSYSEEHLFEIAEKYAIQLEMTLSEFLRMIHA